MCRHFRFASVLVLFVLFVLPLSTLPAAAQPARAADAADTAAPGRHWIELWQSFLAPLAWLTGEGRAIWDPNGGEAANATLPTVGATADGNPL